MAFRASDGKFLWQATHDKLPAGRVNDWPLQGICSTPVRRRRPALLRLQPRRGGRRRSPRASATARTTGVQDETYKTEIDADILWKLRHDRRSSTSSRTTSRPARRWWSATSSTSMTGNGVDEGHINIPSPLAPSFVAVDKNTGELVWENALPGEKIFHGHWSNAGLRRRRRAAPQVVFPGGDGWVYSFEPKTGELLWKFDANPKDAKYELGGAGTAQRDHRDAGVPRRQGLRRRRPGPRARRGARPLLGHRRRPRPATSPRPPRSGTAATRTSTAPSRPRRSTTACSTSRDLSGFLYCLDAKTGKHVLDARHVRRGVGLAVRGRRQGLPRRRGR